MRTTNLKERLNFYTIKSNKSKKKKRAHAFIRAMDRNDFELAKKYLLQGIYFIAEHDSCLWYFHDNDGNLNCDMAEFCLSKAAGLKKNDINKIMFQAAQINDNKTVELAIKYGADVNYIKSDQIPMQHRYVKFIKIERTALMSAVSDSNLDLAKMLISAGAKLNYLVHDYFGNSYSLLHEAVWSVGAGTADCISGCPKCLGMVELLLDSGADTNAIDSQGKTAYDFAMEIGNKKIIQMFKNYN